MKMEDVICWKCGKKGHFFASCTNPPRETNQGQVEKSNDQKSLDSSNLNSYLLLLYYRISYLSISFEYIF